MVKRRKIVIAKENLKLCHHGPSQGQAWGTNPWIKAVPQKNHRLGTVSKSSLLEALNRQPHP